MRALQTIRTVGFLQNLSIVCASGRVVVQSRQLACFVILSRSIRTVRHYVELGQFKRLLKTFLFGEAAAH